MTGRPERGSPVNPHLELLLSRAYSGSLAPDHLADLRKSALTDDTIHLHKIRSVPLSMIPRLLGFDVSGIRSAMLIPFPDPAGGFMDHTRLKVFPPLEGGDGHGIKYLQPRASGVRLFFTLLQLNELLHGTASLWAVEGEKKALALAQLGFPAIGFCGIANWHIAGSRELLRDFDRVQLAGRVVEVVPDGDAQTNDNVRRGAVGFLMALEARGARPRLVRLPTEVVAP